MRKLVTIQTIDDITPIEGADNIELAHIKGWKVVVRKNEFYVGQMVFYFEIDSMIPLDRGYFAFLESRGAKTLDGKKYHRLKTIKLRGQISQGLILPTVIEMINPISKLDENGTPTSMSVYGKSCAPYLDPDLVADNTTDIHDNHDGDYSDYFGVFKWEEPEKFDSGGAKLYSFPDWISKTDEERVQNLDASILKDILAHREKYIATEKIDGTSTTIGVRSKNGRVEEVVCSRRNTIEPNADNAYWQIAEKPLISFEGKQVSPLEYLTLLTSRYMAETGEDCSFVLQGELFGESVQKNPLGIKGRQIAFFNFFKNGVQLSLYEIEKNYPELLSVWVPIHGIKLPNSLDDIIKQPDGVKTKVIGANRDAQIEGFVWRHKSKAYLERTIDLDKVPEEKKELVAETLTVRASFKAISNKYLLKHDN